jgi:hypothetical protein
MTVKLSKSSGVVLASILAYGFARVGAPEVSLALVLWVSGVVFPHLLRPSRAARRAMDEGRI